jgi:hypothetical protein
MTVRPRPIPVTNLRYLNAAMQFSSSTGKANCIQRSAALVLDMPGSEMVFATLRAASPEEQEELQGRGSTVPFIHAWVEWRGWLYAPTSVERTDMRLVAWSIPDYYRVNGASNIRRVPRGEFNRIAKQFRFTSALKHGRDRFGSGEIADALLNAAGVQYTIGPGRAVLPLENNDGPATNT